MNKEQWVFLAALLLLGLGIYSSVSGWLPEKPFQPPAPGRGGGPKLGEFSPPLFSSEDEVCEFRAKGRNPFEPKRETESLPLAVLDLPPLSGLKRVAPGPVPGLGHSRLRPLEEPVAEGEIDLTAPSGEKEEEEEEDDEWGRRRW